jgi:aspartyl-tRNA(Asn)/glutamyl-tRNA(Gln) amidotransferase subunit A
VAELAAGLRSKEFSSVELTKLYLDRIEAQQSALNAFVTVTREQALAAAAEADRALAAGRAGPLTGVPIAHKDIFCTEGVRTTCGSRMLDNFVSPYDATVVTKLKAAGTVMLGKTNMDEFAMGSSNETSYYGPVRNPWNASMVPGGSSGGSAAAVAARLAPIATATDTGGSIRQPAALCGVTGLKPTYGRVSRYGMIAFASSLDQGGVISASAEDAALMLAAMAGFDPNDSTSARAEVKPYREALKRDVKGLRIGLPKEYYGEGIEPDVRAHVEEARRKLEAAGCSVVELSMPHSKYCISDYYILTTAEASSNLARFDGIRYGRRASGVTGLEETYVKSRTEGFGREVKRRIMLGTYVLSSGYYDAYYKRAQKVRRLISQDFIRAFEQCDALLTPTTPTTAFRFGEKSADPLAMYLNDIFTVSANISGVPAISVPVGLDSKRLPIGAQLMTPHFDEETLFALGKEIYVDVLAELPR